MFIPFYSVTIVLPDTLMAMVSSMRNDVGLVHQMPFTEQGRSGFAAQLETVRTCSKHFFGFKKLHNLYVYKY